MFPLITNRNKYIVKEHPKFHPASQDYINYWREQKRRCIEGYWAEDENGKWRYMPGYLYFYANIATITTVDKKTKTTQIKRPSIDDVEWIIFTVLLVCRGFSGFELDDEYTCDSNDTTKKYVEPWEYIKQLHDKPLGKPLYNNSAKNLLLLSSRGIGKTFSIGSTITAEILLDGAKEYSQQIIDNPAKVNVFVGAYKADKSENLLSQVDLMIENLPGAYGSGTTKVSSPFYKSLSGVNKPGSKRIHEYKVKENGNWVKKGSKSQITHEVVTVSNPHSPAAYRATLVIIEEIGLLEADIEEVLGTTSPVLRVGDVKFGSFIGIGTGGDIGKVAQLEKIFRNPDSYEFFGMEDTFENMGRIGLFIPAQYMYREYKDENGNTIWEKANKAIADYRKNKEYTALEQAKMSYPVVPSEIFMSNKQNIFPVTEINQQIKWLLHNQKKLNFSVGNLLYTSKGVEFIDDKQSEPLNRFPIEKGKSLKGALTIYEHPPEYIPEGLYKIVYDPFRDFNIETMDRGVSCGAIYVYKGFNDTEKLGDAIVAQYVGRTSNPDDVHELVIKLSIYYNAKIMPEMDLPGFYKYCISTRKLGLLAPTPYATIGKFNNSSKRRYSVGIMMKGNKLLSLQAEQYISRWLLTERSKEFDELGNITNIRRNIDYIYDIALLEELKAYNYTGNFDRVSALKLLMIWLEETKTIIDKMPLKNETNLLEEYLNNHIWQ